MAAPAAESTSQPRGSAEGRLIAPPGSVTPSPNNSYLQSTQPSQSTHQDFHSATPLDYTPRPSSTVLPPHPSQASPKSQQLFGGLLSPARPLHSPFGSGFQRGNDLKSSAQSTQHTEQAVLAMPIVPEITPENGYLGFCKAAWNLQNGDKKASFEKVREVTGGYSRSGANNKSTTPYYLSCKERKCTFRSNFIDRDVEALWSKVLVYPDHGIKLRWSFLAKSHVPQKVEASANARYSFKCLFCVYLGRTAELHGGTRSYLDHIASEHKGRDLGQVVEYKTKCINNQIANDQENYDINLWPSTAKGDAMVSEWLEDGLLDPVVRQRKNTIDSANVIFGSESGQRGRGSLSENVQDEASSSFERADELFRPTTQYGQDETAIPSSHIQPNVSNPWDEVESNPWASDPAPPQHSLQVPLQISPSARRTSADASQGRLSQSPISIDPPAPQIPPRSELRANEPSHGMQQMQSAFEQAESYDEDNEDTITVCLNEIVECFREASARVEEMKQQVRRELRASFDPILEEALLDAPPEIEKQRSRGFSLFGDAFNNADPNTVRSLQRIERHLHSDLVRPLKKFVGDPTVNPDYRQLTREAESGLLQTSNVLFTWKERLENSNARDSGPHATTSPPPYMHFPDNPSRTSSREIARHSQFSDDSHSAAGSDRQASTASTSSGSHQYQAQPVATDRRRSSVLTNFFKHGRKSATEAPAPTHLEPSRAGITRLDLRNKRPEGVGGQQSNRPVELDSTPLPRRR